MFVPPTSHLYSWPRVDLAEQSGWTHEAGDAGFPGFLTRDLPETAEELAADSRWPILFPSPLCLVSTVDGTHAALEKVVGASIVNRFPYVIALSFCRQSLSSRHHVRRTFMDTLEAGGKVAVQFLPPGADLDRAMQVITDSDESTSLDRLGKCGLPSRPARTSGCPVFDSAYLVYEGRLVEPTHDFGGRPIFARPWIDVGSHRVYFLEITAIGLDQAIARGQSQIHWRSLPVWHRKPSFASAPVQESQLLAHAAYQKGFVADYSFPSPSTIAFAPDEVFGGRAIKHLPPLGRDQVEIDNDRARWPCFFPSSVGMITTWSPGGTPNLMPCGSTTVLSRHPLIVGTAVSYAAINARYAPRASLDILLATRRFGCGIPFVDASVLQAIRYAGNVSLAQDPAKVAHTGLHLEGSERSPRFRELPIHLDCDVIDAIPLGTHVLFLGEVRRASVRADLTPGSPLEWCPWPRVAECPSFVRCAG